MLSRPIPTPIFGLAALVLAVALSAQVLESLEGAMVLFSGTLLWDVVTALDSALQTRREAGARLSLSALFACLVGGLGGGTIACALVGLPPTWMRNGYLLPLYSAVGALVLLTPPLPEPGKYVAVAARGAWETLRAASFVCAVVWGAGLPAASPAIPAPPPVVAIAVAGLLASCGGGILCDCLTLRRPPRAVAPSAAGSRELVGGSGWSLRTPAVLTSPGLSHALAATLAVASTMLAAQGVALTRVRLAALATVLLARSLAAAAT